MIILDGRIVAESHRLNLKQRIPSLARKLGRPPHLAVVLVGDLTASVVYVRNKEKACEQLGIRSSKIELPGDCSRDRLLGVLDQLNTDDEVDAVLVQFPLPSHLQAEDVLMRLSPEKDADGLTYQSLGLLWGGLGRIAPCTPKGVMSILSHYDIPVAGRRAVVVGRSNIVGKPMAHLLLEANATVTLCHSKTKNISDYTREAEIVVVAAGKRGLLGREDFKKGAVVLDVGIHGVGQGKAGLSGDVRFEELEGWAFAATPVPGGVGPMTIMTLLENTVDLAEIRMEKKKQKN